MLGVVIVVLFGVGVGVLLVLPYGTFELALHFCMDFLGLCVCLEMEKLPVFPMSEKPHTTLSLIIFL